MKQESRRTLSKIIWLLLLLFGLMIVAVLWGLWNKQGDFFTGSHSAANFSASGAGDQVTLSGVLPTSRAINTIADAAKKRYSTVENQLKVGEVASPAWIEKLPALFSQVDGWPQWSIEIDANGTRFRGQAENAATVDALRKGYLSNFSELKFEGQIAPSTVAKDLTGLLATSATFETGSTRLSGQARGLLNQAIDILKLNSNAVVVVAGHTDNRGDAKQNMVLSQARAQAVVEYLVAGGIDGHRLKAVGYGEIRPIADNSTIGGRTQNRRIEFEVKQGR